MAAITLVQQFLGLGQEHEDGEMKTRYVGAIAGSVILFVSAFAFNLMRRSKDFTTDQGKRITEIPGDSRMSKFIRSRELSQQGEDVAGTEPYLIRSGPYRELVISQPDQVHEFYQHDSKRHTKPRNMNLGEQFGSLLGPCVGGEYGDQWRTIRNHFDPPFAFHSVALRVPRFTRGINDWLQSKAPNVGVSELDSKVDFRFLVFKLLSLHLYEDAFDDRSYWILLELNDQYDGIITDILSSKYPDSKLFNLFRWGPHKRLREFQVKWRDFHRLIIENARAGAWACPMEVIYRGVDPQKDFTEDAFLATMTEILFANVNISAEVFHTIFTNLASKTSIQTELRKEIQEWKSKPDFDLPKYLAKQDTLLNRVLMEGMRICPAFWFSMAESTADAKKIGQYNIPAGTPVVIDTRRLNNEAVTWGAASDGFNPDRFLKLPSQNLRCGFMRFGTGAASGRCLGKNVADAVFKLTMIEVVERFRLESASGSEEKGRKVDIRLVSL
ncbi:Cytochrome monooxygenase apdB [Penicillium viridicatum]|nr:Cytochrome monooxygenase apdB [Penicillium viridicatum]